MSEITRSVPQPAILLTHTPARRALYYPAAALTALDALAPVRLHQGPTPLAGAALVEAAQGIRLIVADSESPAPAPLFAATPGLVAFLRCAVDIRNIDVAAASAAGILVTRATPGFAAAVAELVLAAMIDLARGISHAVGQYRAGLAPTVAMGRQLAGSTVGIIGYGAIGRRLAANLLALDARILVHDPHTHPAQGEPTDFPTLLAQADFVVLLAPALPETAHLMNAAAFARMKPGAYFINASRSPLVDEPALEAALDSRHLAGAALDVGSQPGEMPSLNLAARPDVIATPHIGGLTPEATAHQAHDTVRQAAAILAGRIPDGAVNAPSAHRLKP